MMMMMMRKTTPFSRRQVLLSAILFAALFSILLSHSQAKKLDPYKVLGVEKNASQREIQKAFHKLSLQYHPDKNKSKGAQQKFEEINNAYDILSDEEKRKNYDMYGDEVGNPNFGAGGTGSDHGGYTYYTSGGPGQSEFNYRPGGWQTMGGSGGSKSFSFSFGNPGGGSSFGFDVNDLFSDFLGGGFKSGSQFDGFKSSGRSQSGSRNFAKNIRVVDSQVFRKEIADQGMTWLLMSYTPKLEDINLYESVIEKVAGSFQGALKTGRINCESEQTLCKDLGIYPRRAPRVFVYSIKSCSAGTLMEFNGDMVVKSLKTFCEENLPRFSKRVDLKHFDLSSSGKERLPRVMLLSTKKETPVIWRVLSGLYCKRIIFYDTEVHDVSDAKVKKLGVDALPAIVGWLSDGEKHILKTGISAKDLKSAVQDLSALIDIFEKKNKKSASSHDRSGQSDTGEKQVPVLSGSNFDALCGDNVPVCIIGAFRSLRARGKLEPILSAVSHKTLSRQQHQSSSSKDPLSYALLDATKQSSFLKAFDKSAFKSLDNFLVAYKPKRGKFAAFLGEVTTEEVEKFISSVLNGDVQFNKTLQKPILH